MSNTFIHPFAKKLFLFCLIPFLSVAYAAAQAPTTQATGVTFTNTTATSATISWTNGNGSSRAVFILEGSTGVASILNAHTYTASTSYGSGATGWYCVYNGTGRSVNVTSLVPGTTYRIMTLEYNGTPGAEKYLLTPGTGNPANVSTLGPIISSSGSPSALSTTYSTASPTGIIKVSGANMKAGILVTAPSGFEISASPSSGFDNTITVGSAGVIASIPVYIRLKATDAAATYSGNVELTSSGATDVNIKMVASKVNKAPLNITANNVTKAYGVAITGGAGSTAFTATGLKNSETIGTVTTTYGAGSAATGTATIHTGAVIPSAATGGTFTASNYAITYNPGNIIVTQVPLTITATDPHKVYGTASGTSSTSFTAVGTMPGETITGVTLIPATTVTATTPAGSSYVVIPSAATGTGGFLASNYNITYTAFKGTVGKRALTVNATGGNKTYNNSTATIVTLSDNRLSGDVLTTAYATATFADKNIGTGKTVTVSGISISGDAAANYIVNTTATTTANITAATATVTAQPDTKVYNQTTASSVVPTVSGLFGADAIGTPPIQNFTTSNVGTSKTLIPSGLVINDGNNGNNYIVKYLPNNTGTITPMVLTYTATSTSRNYGVSNQVFTGTVTGFVGSDTQASATTGTLSFTSTATATKSAPGSYSITGSGLSATSYTFVQAPANSTALTVTPAPLTITANNANKTYGEVNPTLTVSYTGFVGTDNAASLTAAPTVTTRALKASATGSYPIAAGGAASPNYTIGYIDGTLTVTPASLIITANNINKINGQDLTGGTGLTAFTTKGLQNSETIGSLSIACGTGSTAALGTYTGSVIPSLATGGTFTPSNYNITYIPGDIIVTSTAQPIAQPLAQTTTPSSSSSPNIIIGSFSGISTATGTFNVSGENLKAGIIVIAPSGCEVSTSSSSGFGNTVTIEASDALKPTPVYVRLINPAGEYSGNVVLRSAGVKNKQVKIYF